LLFCLGWGTETPSVGHPPAPLFFFFSPNLFFLFLTNFLTCFFSPSGGPPVPIRPVTQKGNGQPARPPQQGPTNKWWACWVDPKTLRPDRTTLVFAPPPVNCPALPPCFFAFRFVQKFFDQSPFPGRHAALSFFFSASPPFPFYKKPLVRVSTPPSPPKQVPPRLNTDWTHPPRFTVISLGTNTPPRF